MWNVSNKEKYAKWYLGLILNVINRGHTSKREAKKALGYVEGHHIIPYSFDKSVSKVKDNIIFCTAREHFLIHLLMTKMFSNERLTGLSKSAVRAFTMCNNEQQRRVTSKYFEKLRIICAEAIKGNTLGSKTKGYRFYTNGTDFTTLPENSEPPGGWWRSTPGKGLISITNGVESIKIKSNDRIPEGWWKGSTRKGKPSPLRGRKREHYATDHQRNLKIAEAQRNRIWVTDGLSNLRLTIGEDIPEGWYRGRTGVVFTKAPCPHCGREIDPGNFNRHTAKCGGNNELGNS